MEPEGWSPWRRRRWRRAVPCTTRGSRWGCSRSCRKAHRRRVTPATLEGYLSQLIHRLPPLWNGTQILYLGCLHAENAAETWMCKIREATIGEEGVIHLKEETTFEITCVLMVLSVWIECSHLVRQSGRVCEQGSWSRRYVQDLLALLVQSDLVGIVFPVVEGLKNMRKAQSLQCLSPSIFITTWRKEVSNLSHLFSSGEIPCLSLQTS